MKNYEMLEIIHEIEKNIDIKKLVYDGVEFWPLLRIMLCSENLNRPLKTEIVKVGLFQKITLVSSALFEYFYDIKHNASLKQSDCYFLTASNTRYFVKGKGHFDIFTSPLMEWTDKSCHIDELVPNSEYRLPRSEKTHFIQRNYYFIALKSRFFKKDETAYLDVWHKIERELLRKGYKTNINSNVINRVLTQFILWVRWFEKRLNKLNPQYVIVVCYYSLPCIALVHVANKLGVTTIDLQHGVQGKYHFAYASFYNIPKDGWTLLPKIFWNWTKRDVEHINSWGENKHIGFDGGIIWHNYLKDISINMIDQLTEKNTEDKPCILVSFQPLPDNQTFLDKLKIAIESQQGQSYFWLLRLHPGMFNRTSRFKLFFDNVNCDVELATSIPLPLLLENTVLHITRSSSVVIEAALYGINSFIEEGNVYYQDEKKDGLVHYFSDSLLDILDEKILERRASSGGLVNSKERWRELLKTTVSHY